MNGLTSLEWLAIKALAIVLLLAAVLGYGYHKGFGAGDTAGYKRGHAEAVDIQHRWDEDRARMLAAATQKAAQVAADTAAITAAQQKAEHEALLANQARDAARRDAAAAHRSLLDAARAAAADPGRGAKPGDSAALAGGTGAVGSGSVLVDVLEGSDATSGELADYADGLAVSLGACHAEYDAVRATGGH